MTDFLNQLVARRGTNNIQRTPPVLKPVLPKGKTIADVDPLRDGINVSPEQWNKELMKVDVDASHQFLPPTEEEWARIVKTPPRHAYLF